MLYGPDGSERKLLVGDQLFVHVGGGVILGDRLRLALNLPITAYENGEDARAVGTAFSAPSSAGVGDLRLSADFRLLGEYGDAFTAAIGVQAHLPTGKRDDYTSDGKVRIVPQAHGGRRSRPLRLRAEGRAAIPRSRRKLCQ